jgi:class 3 adenylate cyclase
MAAAHTVLYSKVRALALANQGYEVKNLGDGFFLTFESTLQSLTFCLQLQRELALTVWSREIINWRRETDGEQGKPMHRGKGLTVRLGLHYGQPFASHIDPVSGRMDYHGNMINVSSRIMGQAGAEEIALSDAAIIALDGEASALRIGQNAVQLSRVSVLQRILRQQGLFDEFEVVRKGPTKLKGVPGELFITLIRLRR